MSKTQIVPKVGNGGLYEALGSANSLVVVPVPGTSKDRSDTMGKPLALEVYFVDNAGDPCEGRISFSATDEVITVAANDIQLGHHKKDRQDSYYIPNWAKFIYLASPEASAVAKGSWLFE